MVDCQCGDNALIKCNDRGCNCVVCGLPENRSYRTEKIVMGKNIVHSDKKGWIGVDLDGTLFTYDTWVGWNVFGEPIMPMVRRVRQWLADGREVRIVTARVGLPVSSLAGRLMTDRERGHQCRVTGQVFSDAMMVEAIQEHLQKHGLPALPVQCWKDVDMIELWDDRAIQVVVNTGRTLADEHAAELAALRGAP